MYGKVRTPRAERVESRIARLAGRAHGVVTRQQLLALGITKDQIDFRLRAGSLHCLFRGVYRVGHLAPSMEATYLAAVLACGDGALLCGRAAGHLFGLLRGRSPQPEVVALNERRVSGVKTRRSRRVEIQGTTWKRIPVTTVPQTLVDLAAVLDEDELARTCHEAGVRHRTTPRQVMTILDRRPRARGAGKLRRILLGETQVTLSRLEKRFLEMLHEAGLPRPKTNRPVGGRRVDCNWPRHRLIVELDGYRYHHSRHAWELDRRREREARARGDEFRRYTFGDVFEEPRLMLAELQSLLAD